MEQIKGIIDRMGGIDGIVNSMGKVQKVMSGFQQMAPMVKLFMGSFGKGKEQQAHWQPKRMPQCSVRVGAKKTLHLWAS